MSKLDSAVKRVATDHHITATEAKSLIKEAKASGSKKPIDDIFKAIDRTDASIDTKATRLILKELDQKMTRSEWVHYAQKAASPSGVWGPGSDGSVKVKRADLPEGLRKVFDKWADSSVEDTPEVVSFDVAGKPAFLMSQYSEFGTSYGLFDAAGKSIELKEDTQNVQREARRIQGAYDSVFRSPPMKNWKDSVQHTEIGVVRNYAENATLLTGAKRTEALTPAIKKVISEQEKSIKRGDPETQIFKNKTDGSLLVISQARTATGAEFLSLFNKSGALVKQFTIDV
ncbi:MAG: hypothetical protein QM817_01305 [Archangium sp.]